jgi:3-dehydroquinate dehydratase II
MPILILHGPNLNLLGTRQPEIYGNMPFEIFLQKLQRKYTHIEFEYYQSNHEGDLIDKLQQCGFTYSGIIFNAGAYAHTSLALADAIASISTPVIELHISNVFAREEIRQKSLISSQCKGVISGFGYEGYELALQYFHNDKKD